MTHSQFAARRTLARRCGLAVSAAPAPSEPGCVYFTTYYGRIRFLIGPRGRTRSVEIAPGTGSIPMRLWPVIDEALQK